MSRRRTTLEKQTLSGNCSPPKHWHVAISVRFLAAAYGLGQIFVVEFCKEIIWCRNSLQFCHVLILKLYIYFFMNYRVIVSISDNH